MPRWAATTVAWRAVIGLAAAAAMLAAAVRGVCQSVPDLAAVGPQTEQVVEVRVVGNRRTAREKILTYVRTREGRPFDRFMIEEDVRRLNSSGLFVTVRASQQQVPGGRIVVFEVVERPTLEYVKYTGNQAIAKQTLAKESGLKAGDPLDTFAVENARRRIEDYYRRQGFAKVQVTVLEGASPEDRGAVFSIHEGPKQRILWTNFVGNTIASDAKLRSKIQSKQGILWIFKGKLDPEQLERDRRLLVEYYRSLGFFSARIGQPIVEFNESRTWATITFVIDEGPRYQVRAVRFLGNQIFSSDELQKELKLGAGQYFSQADLQADLASLREKYGSIGYVFADIEAEPRYLVEPPGMIDLVYTVQEGQQYRVGRIEVDIKGDNPHTRTTTVLNRLSLYPGQIVDVRELRASERRLRFSGLFEVDPAKGEAPKIALTPPDPDQSARGIARRPRPSPLSQADEPSQSRQVVYRPPDDGAAGPSVLPSGCTGHAFDVPASYPTADQNHSHPAGALNTGWVNLRVSGQLRPEAQLPAQPSTQTTEPWTSSEPAVHGQPGVSAQQPGSMGQISPSVDPAIDVQPMVVRGQYTPETGVSMPPLYGSDSWYVDPRTSVGGRSAAPAAGTPAQGSAAQTLPTGSPWPGASRAANASSGYQSAQATGTSVPGSSIDSRGGMPAPQVPGGIGQAPQTGWSAGGYRQWNGQPSPGTTANPGTVAGPPIVQQSPPAAGSLPIEPMMPGDRMGTAQPTASSPSVQAPASAWTSSAGAGSSTVASAQFSPTLQPTGDLPMAFPGAAPSQARPEDLAPLLGAPPDQEELPFVPLFPQVYEARTGRFMISAGINSDAGVVGSIVIDEQNFDWRRLPRSWHDIWDGTAWRGAGQRFRVEAVPGTQVQRYAVTFQEPYLFDTNVGLGLNAYFYNRRYWEWDEERLGGRISLGYQFSHDLSGTFAVRAMNTKIYDPISAPGVIPELDEVLGDNELYGFRLQLTHDTRDSSFLPTEGHVIEMGFEQVIGSFVYPRADLDVRRYFLLWQHPDGTGRHVLSLGAQAYYSGPDTPIYEHFYAGGYSSLRGFEFRGVSPVDAATGSVHIGGEFMLLASAEYMFSLTPDDMIRAVVFCDAGTVQPQIDQWTQDFRVAPGFGFRITVPALGPAPIALDFAFPVSKEDTDEEQMFSFFVGFLK